MIIPCKKRIVKNCGNVWQRGTKKPLTATSTSDATIALFKPTLPKISPTQSGEIASESMNTLTVSPVVVRSMPNS